MPHGDDAVAALREALKHSPENLPLRLHLAETLVGLARYDEAEKEYRAGLAQAPHDQGVKLGLANAFHAGGKHSAARVIVDELMKQPNPPPRARVLLARLLLREGDVERAVRQYKEAVQDDESVADSELAGRLGIHASAEDERQSDVVDGRVRSPLDAPEAGPDVPVERPKITFKDVGGMDGVKDEIRMKIIHPLTHADLYKAYGKAVGGGILMYGPPGCGKTHLARATAGEIRAGFMSVGINDVLNMWLGNSERNLPETFERARRGRPCVLFFDEVDALAASRADMRHSAAHHLINQFLAEMDGINGNNEGVLILAATNAPWHVDPAFRRPGRFDRILFAPPPDAPARAATLRILLHAKPVQDVDCDHVAKKTDAFSGADLKAVVDVAVEQKLREAMKAGGPKTLTTRDLLAALGTLRPTTKEWFATARNHALYANQGGLYDDVL